MSTGIRAYVSRYYVPFYFDYGEDGYRRIIHYFRNVDQNYLSQRKLPGDCKWVEMGFWENYRSSSGVLPESDIYTYLPSIMKERPEEPEKYESNIGDSLILKSDGDLFKAQYVYDAKGDYLDSSPRMQALSYSGMEQDFCGTRWNLGRSKTRSCM